MAVELFSGITQDQLVTVLREVSGHQGIRTVSKRDDGYGNGDEIFVFPFGKLKRRLGEYRTSFRKRHVAVLVSHQHNAVDDMMDTPQPDELIAPPTMISGVRRLLALTQSSG